jgi:branched-subunit amino acid transport protein
MATNIILIILVTSFATYISRFLGAFTSEKIVETSKIYKWFNCVAYSTLAALISRMLIFPSGDLSDVNYILRITVILLSILIFYVTKRNLVYPTVLSDIILAKLNIFEV